MEAILIICAVSVVGVVASALINRKNKLFNVGTIAACVLCAAFSVVVYANVDRFSGYSNLLAVCAGGVGVIVVLSIGINGLMRKRMAETASNTALDGASEVNNSDVDSISSDDMGRYLNDAAQSMFSDVEAAAPDATSAAAPEAAPAKDRLIDPDDEYLTETEHDEHNTARDAFAQAAAALQGTPDSAPTAAAPVHISSVSTSLFEDDDADADDAEYEQSSASDAGICDAYDEPQTDEAITDIYDTFQQEVAANDTEELFLQAAALKAEGGYVQAQQMFEQCLEAAQNDDQRKDAEMAALDCMLRARDYEQASSRIFAILRKGYDLTKDDKRRLSTILSILKKKG